VPVDLIVLCGFLGSGKTTLLVDFLRRGTTADTGVIVNEVGEIGIDGAIVNDDVSGAPLTLLANGCVCCSMRDSLVDTVGAMLDAPRPPGSPPLARIVVEASGLSRPGPIVAALTDPQLAARAPRVSVVSTFDCENGAARLNEFDEAIAQLAGAQRVVFTKVDRVSSAVLTGHRNDIAALNPLAHIVAEEDRAQAVELAFGASRETTSAEPGADFVHVQRGVTGVPIEHPRIRVMTGTPRAELAWQDLSRWLDDLAALCGERLLRFKALLHVADCPEPILVQSVGTTFSAPVRMTRRIDAADVCVVITRDIEADEINGLSDLPVVRLAMTRAGSAGILIHQRRRHE
jgi:G3E family GTPase